MSFSTASLDFDSDRSSFCGHGVYSNLLVRTTLRHTNESITEGIGSKAPHKESHIVQDGWSSELTSRMHILPNDVNDYISLYVPSPSEPPPRALPRAVFDQWQPVAGKEKDMYLLLVRVAARCWN